MSGIFFNQVTPQRPETSPAELNRQRRAAQRRPEYIAARRRRTTIQACLFLLLASPIGIFLNARSQSLAQQAALFALGQRLEPIHEITALASADTVTLPAVVQGLRRFEGENFTRLVLDLSHEPAFRATSTANSLNITLSGAQLSPLFEAGPADDKGLVQQVAAVAEADSVKLRLRFRPGTSFAAFTLDAPARLVIDVCNTAAGGSFAAELNRILAPLGSLAQHGPIRRIVLDPGHGGRDLGAVGPSGYTEKELTLNLALRLKQELETRLGLEVRLTRTGDYYQSLAARSELANNSAADLFISLHANATEPEQGERHEDETAAGEPHGIETYFLNRATSLEEQRIAERENTENGEAAPAVSTISSAKLVESHLLAAYVQRNLVAGLRRVNPAAARDRGVKQAPFYVLSNTRIPSVLVEVSFITNPADEQRLRTSAFQQKIAESLTEGIKSYITNLAQRQRPPQDQVVIR